MRIVVDMQGAQTESRFRGIGRYTLSFVQAVVRNRGTHEIILALNGLLADSIESVRAAFDGVLSQDNIRVWYAPGPVKENQPENAERLTMAKLIREAFLASMVPDVIHISSLFEGYVDDAVTSIGCFDHKIPVSVTLYDLIPLLNPKDYLQPSLSYANYYNRKIEYLKQARICLAISEFTRQEGMTHLDVQSNRIINVSAAVEPYFKPEIVDGHILSQIRDRFNLNRPFILYTGGYDQRKNLPRLIQAFAALPNPLRTGHQLLLVGNISEGDLIKLKIVAKKAGLRPDELCFTGYVNDKELVQLYNLCKLFVFPSWYEGFGLPVMEAMACGAPSIAANASSLNEIVTQTTALFDPFDIPAITAKIAKALEDDTFRSMLRAHGLQQAKLFSWDASAKRAITAWEEVVNVKPKHAAGYLLHLRKHRLAFVSPLPPERTGIADYSAALLPALATHYDIDIVVAQDRVNDPWINRHIKVHDVSWLREHASEIGRVLYQFGNSPFHQHMLPLLYEIPGAVVLHDIYISALLAWLELCAGAAPVWTNALYTAHGYGAVRERYLDAAAAQLNYPVNLNILQYSQGIIVHSEYAYKLIKLWYGDLLKAHAVIPSLRSPEVSFDKAAARKQLGIAEDDFVVCSFGFLGTTKLNHRLLNCWLKSALARDCRCRIVFVGENHGDTYGKCLLQTIQSSDFGNRISITGFVSSDIYDKYLMAADLAVQLRTHSRGETSASVLDCMNHALPLIVNACGSMAELDPNAVWILPDEFDDTDLIGALEMLWNAPSKRRTLGQAAREIILNHHTPTECARQYAEAIERFHYHAQTATPNLISTIAATRSMITNDSELRDIAHSISATLPLQRPAKRLYLDISATCRNDLRSGIERVARSLLMALLENPPTGYRIEPVYLSDIGKKWHYCHARRYMLGLLGCPQEALEDDPVEPECGDLLLILDLSGNMLIQAERSKLFLTYRNHGVKIYSIVFDLLPIRMPHVFPPGADQTHLQWLQTVSTLDGAICISQSVADDLATWQKEVGIEWKHRRPFRISWFHLGADIACVSTNEDIPEKAKLILHKIQTHPSFLMVGTIEPRKGYLQVIEAFSQLWEDGIDVNLVIVGKEGWTHLPDNKRRDIPETIVRLRNHHELNQHLFWLEGISDEYLEYVYSACVCLVAASFGEGFGLPLIEAAHHKLPIIARDIPVFREVAGDHAFYFKTDNDGDLAKTLREWLTLAKERRVPISEGMHYLTWKQSAERLIRICIRK